MARPSMSAARTAQIIAAFERCVARRGLEATSLEDIAQEAGLQRSILRHYVGNRADLIEALAVTITENYNRQMEALLEWLPDEGRLSKLLDVLFPRTPHSDSGQITVIEELIATAETYPRTRAVLNAYVETFVGQVESELKRAYPNAPRRNRWQVAYGIVAIYFNQEALVTLDLPVRYRSAARHSAETLIASLG